MIVAANRGSIIEIKDIEYVPRGYYSVLEPGETQTFNLDLFSAFVLIGIGNGDNQFGIFYVTSSGVGKLLGVDGIQVAIQPDTHRLTIHNNLNWYIDYTVLGAVTRVY